MGIENTSALDAGPRQHRLADGFSVRKFPQSVIARGTGLTGDNTWTDVSVRSVIFFFCCGLALVFVSDVPNIWGGYFVVARVSLAVLLFITLLLPIRPAILLMLLLALAGQDIVSSGNVSATDLDYSTASIWQMGLGPLNPSMIITALLIWRLSRIRKKIIPSFVKWAFLWFVTVPVIAGLVYGGMYSEHAGVQVAQDLKFVIMLLTSIVLFLSVMRGDRKYLSQVVAVFVGVLFARHLVDLIYVIANVGPVLSAGVSRGSEDSAKGGVVFLLYFGLILFVIQKRPILGILITIPSVILLVAYGTRNLWVTFVFGVLVLLLFTGVRRWLILVPVGVVLLSVGIWALRLVNPRSLEIVQVRSRSITEGRPVDEFAVRVQDNWLSRIDQVRYAQILNVFDSLGKRYAYLWGTGYGGYYEDSAVLFQHDLKSSFAQYSLDEGRYFRTHSFSTHMFLKYGLFGMIFIYALWFIPLYGLFRIWRRRNMFAANQPLMFHAVILCIAAFMPTAMFQTYWSGKGLFINGLIIAVALEFSRHSSGLGENFQRRKRAATVG